MMRFLRAILPNLTIALNVAMMIVVYLDRRNPMMGFFVGTPFLSLAAACCVCSVVSAVLLYRDWRNRGAKAESSEDFAQNNK